ncbi:hypothetical protein TRFO_21960 [Tritrichomonas foetus]|uniref:Uncharacterized protein n=1 Tax=Tritrichomonas foetus TaxID=1144522 RepID=A0A1J4KHU3_9EUKA|nr:hypothetical protein TRFO_21960 [Tritrichomonas foetus]|eukprot:OHT09222.1 hypothetical protein TRFO_21960 [Tritrichomonas foetus]
MKSNSRLSSNSSSRSPKKSPHRSTTSSIASRRPISQAGRALKFSRQSEFSELANFTPEPPVDIQYNEINEKFNVLKARILSLNGAKSDIDDSISATVFSSQKVLVQISEFSNALQKLLGDLSQLFTRAVVRKDNNEIQSTTEQASEAFKNLENLFCEVRKLQSTFLQQTISKIQYPKYNISIFADFNNSVEELNHVYLSNIWEMCNLSVSEKINSSYFIFRPIFINRMKNIENEIKNLALETVTLINKIKYAPTKNDNFEGDDDLQIEIKTEELQKLAIKNYGNVIRPLILSGLQNIFPPLRSFWTIDSSTNQPIEVENNENNNEDQSPENDDDYNRLILPSQLFSGRLEHLNTLSGFLENLKIEEGFGEEEEEEEEAGFFEKEPLHPLIPYLENLLTDVFDDLVEATRCFWALSSKLKRDEALPIFAKSMIDVLQSRADNNDNTLKLTTVASIFKLAVTINDENTSSEVGKVLIHIISNKMHFLQKLRHSEIIFISSEAPEFFFSNDDDDEIDSETAQINKNKLRKIYNDKFAKLKETAAQISESLFICQETVFLYHRNAPVQSNVPANPDNSQNGENIPAEGENQGENDQQKNIEELFANFSKFDLQFNVTAHDHLANLQKYLIDIFANVLINQSPSKDVESMSEDARSVVSLSARKAAKNKVTRKKVEQNLTIAEKMQVQFTREAIARTYEEIFSSLRSLITVAIRNLDADSAEKMNKELRNMNTEYLGQLEELRKARVEEMDVKGTKEIEATMSTAQVDTNNLIIKCLEESLADVLEQTLENYQTNIQAIEDDYQVQEEISKKDFDKRFKQLERNEHMDSLVLLEKQLKIELMREEQRPIAALNDRQALIKQLLNAKEYEAAEKEKKKLEKETQAERAERKKIITMKYERLKKQKINQQYRALNNLDNSFQVKSEKYKQDKERKLQEQKNMLASSIRASQQRILLFGTRLLQNDAKMRKELSIRFDKIVNSTMKEHGMQDILQSKK